MPTDDDFCRQCGGDHSTDGSRSKTDDDRPAPMPEHAELVRSIDGLETWHALSGDSELAGRMRAAAAILRSLPKLKKQWQEEAAAAEREACALAVEAVGDRFYGALSEQCADVIRARGEKR